MALASASGRASATARHKRFTPVELIVDETDWNPPARGLDPETSIAQPPVSVRLELWESGLQRKVKAAGGKWDRQQRAWLLQPDQVRALGLEGRVFQSP